MFDFDDEDKENPIGSVLRYHREQKKLSIDQISEELKVREEYLEAMEHGRFDLLPTGFYRRSFLRAYAEYLKLDADPILKMLEEQERSTEEDEGESPTVRKVHLVGALEEEKIKKEEAPLRKAAVPTRIPSRESRAGYWFLVFLGLLVGAACLIFLFNLGIKKDQKTSVSQAMAEAESLMVSPEPVDTMELFTDLLDEKIGASSELILRIEAAGQSWIRVIPDGAELYTGFINEKMNVEFKAKNELSINLGKNQGVKAWLNGFEMKPLEKGVTRLNRDNFKKFISTDRANEIVREHK
jgi:transcriptional regulator with XRE-family HTH domain